MADDLELQRLRQFSVLITDQSDTYTITGFGDLAARMTEPVVKTIQGMGYQSLSSPLLSAAGEDTIPLVEVLEMAATLPACTVRAVVAGWPVFFGRIWTFRIGRAIRTPHGLRVPVVIECAGAAIDYSSEMAEADAEYTDDDADMSASELVRSATRQQRHRHNLVQAGYQFIEDTSRNIAPIQVSQGTRLLDVINQAMKGGSIDPEDQEWIFLVYDGFPVVKPRQGPPEWFQDLEATGMGWTLEMERYASDVRVMWTDRDGNTNGNEVISNTNAIERWNGYERSNTITLNGVNQDGADGGGLAYLLRQEIPIAFDGRVEIPPEPGQLWGMIAGAEHQMQPVYMVRAGDNVGITGLMPHEAALLPDPLRVFNVANTELNLRTGTLTYEPDRLSVVGRLNESPALVAAWLNATEPARSKGIDIRVESRTTVTFHSTSNTTPDMDPSITFRPPRVMEIKITVETQARTRSNQDREVWLGYRFNDERFNYLDGKVSKHTRIDTSTESTDDLKHATFHRIVYPDRTYQIWGCAVGGASLVDAATWALRVQG